MLANTFKKEYIAILDGILKQSSGTINAGIARKPNSIIEREINDDGESAITHYTLLHTDEIKSISVVSFILETGRTHQIRLHSKHIGHPIIGDTLYGSSSSLISRQALHSNKISFTHPITLEPQEYSSPLPDDMKSLID